VNLALPRTRAEFVAAELRRQIVSGELPAGAKLRQAEVADQFDLSTTPVREAFTALAREGLVRQDAHRGVVVFRPTLGEIRENYEIRMALEPLATELATKRVDEAMLSRLDQLLDEMNQPIDAARGPSLNRDFHRTIYAASGRQHLLRMIEQLRDSADTYVRLLVAKHPPGYYDAVRREHADIVAAIRASAPKRASKAMRAHLQHNLDQLKDLLPD
jgi:DNA-binding GntR family transcriptional regulator